MITAEQANNLKQTETLRVIELSIMEACAKGINYIVTQIDDKDLSILKELGYEIKAHPGRFIGDRSCSQIQW